MFAEAAINAVSKVATTGIITYACCRIADKVIDKHCDVNASFQSSNGASAGFSLHNQPARGLKLLHK